MADQIHPKIWLGNVCAAISDKFLIEQRISCILSMADEWSKDNVERYANSLLHDRIIKYDKHQHNAIRLGMEVSPVIPIQNFFKLVVLPIV